MNKKQDIRLGKILSILGFIAFISLLIVIFNSNCLAAPTPNISLPDINIGTNKPKTPTEMALPIQLLFFLTTLSMAPYLLFMTTAFIRVSIVLSFIRTAMGTQQVPHTQVLIGLALFITFYVMMPVGKEINDKAIKPYTQRQISWNQFLDRTSAPLKKFMLKQTRDKELKLFIRLGKLDTKKIKKREQVPVWVLIPAYVLSEIKTAFEIGFLIYLPFLVVDMVVSCILMAMGMFMLSPMTISTPFKIIMFVLVDGWQLIVESLIKSFK